MATDFGADPTGKTDASAAISAAIAKAWQVQTLPNATLNSGEPDLGGVIVDFEGGQYTVSQPVVFPSAGGGNVHFRDGTIRACATFSRSGFLFEVNKASGNVTEADGFYEDLTFEDLMFDAAHRGGGVWLKNAKKIEFHNCWLYRYATKGIFADEGQGNVYISECFFGKPNA